MDRLWDVSTELERKVKKQYTKQEVRKMNVNLYFENALDDLLLEHSIDEITVKDIVGHSGLGRSTFYKYYIDKYDLLNRMVKRTMEETILALDTYPYREAMSRLYTEVEKKRRTYANAFKSSDENSPLRYMEDCGIKKMEKMYREAGLDPTDPVRQIVIKTVINSGCVILRDWTNGSIQAPKETVMIALFASFPSEILWLLDRQSWKE